MTRQDYEALSELYCELVRRGVDQDTAALAVDMAMLLMQGHRGAELERRYARLRA
jgi:hypothetical protein